MEGLNSLSDYFPWQLTQMWKWETLIWERWSPGGNQGVTCLLDLWMILLFPFILSIINHYDLCKEYNLLFRKNSNIKLIATELSPLTVNSSPFNSISCICKYTMEFQWQCPFHLYWHGYLHIMHICTYVCNVSPGSYRSPHCITAVYPSDMSPHCTTAVYPGDIFLLSRMLARWLPCLGEAHWSTDFTPHRRQEQGTSFHHHCCSCYLEWWLQWSDPCPGANQSVLC